MKQPLKWPLYFKYLPDGELNLIGLMWSST